MEYHSYLVHEDRSGPIKAVAISFIVLTTVGLILRLWARHMQELQFTWADVLMPISWVVNIGLYVCMLLEIRFGGGRHEDILTHSNIVHFLKTFYYAIPILYLAAVVFSKLAILDLYLHIFLTRRTQIICFALGAIIILNFVANLLVEIFQCTPQSKLWHLGSPGHCINIRVHAAWASFANIITDIAMILIPVPMILRLPSSRSQRIGVYFTFLVGNLGLVTAICRFVAIYLLAWKVNGPDPTWHVTHILIWTSIEPGVYHMAACFITFRPIIRLCMSYLHKSSSPVAFRLSGLLAKRKARQSTLPDIVESTPQTNNNTAGARDNTIDSDKDDYLYEDHAANNVDFTRYSNSHSNTNIPGRTRTLSNTSRNPYASQRYSRRISGATPTSSGVINVQHEVQIQSGVSLDELVHFGSHSSINFHNDLFLPLPQQRCSVREALQEEEEGEDEERTDDEKKYNDPLE